MASASSREMPSTLLSSSTLAAATLRQLGFLRTAALDGGMKAWREGGYRLLTLDTNRKWQDYEASGPLRRRSFASPFALSLLVDGRPTRLPPELTPEQELELAKSAVVKSTREDDAQRLTPQVLLLSSGEITPFVLQMSAPGLTVRYRIEADALGRIKRERSMLPNGARA